MSRLNFSRGPHSLALCASFLLSWGCQEKKPKDEVSVQTQAASKAEAEPTKKGEANPASASVEPPPWATRLVADSGFPCDVELVLSQSCRRCHWDPRENDAPFSMIKFDDTQKMRSGKPIYKLMEQMVEADLMPPLDALVEPAVTPLSSAQKKTLLDWLKKGAPRFEEKCAL